VDGPGRLDSMLREAFFPDRGRHGAGHPT
jgi:hypothetical protein